MNRVVTACLGYCIHIPRSCGYTLSEDVQFRSQTAYILIVDEQANIVILDAERSVDLTSWLTKIFLPQGYPDSVSSDYLAYQIWDTAQAFCSTITGTLATQEVLRGVGVGSTSATPLAATVTWVLKDGCGHLGRILFAYSHGTYLDAYSKKWRLYADTLNDLAMCVEIALPLFKNYTTAVLCASTVMRAIVGVAGGATRVAMTQHHAVRGNLADVSAKDSAQETAVNLVASFAALAIIGLLGSSLPIFLTMVVLHIVFNYLAVRSVCLSTLNEPRYLQVIDLYLHREEMPTPYAVNATEPIIFYQLGRNLLDLKLCGFRIQLGASIKQVIQRQPKAFDLQSIKDAYVLRKYLILPCVTRRRMYVLVKDVAKTDDVLCAYFHAVLLSMLICAINEEGSSVETSMQRPFAQVCYAVASAEWSREPVRDGSGLQYGPSLDLVRYADKIANKEWLRVRAGLERAGWDLSKHLLILDEWRVISRDIRAKAISTSMNRVTSTSTADLDCDGTFACVLEEGPPPPVTSKSSFVIEPDTPTTKSESKTEPSAKSEHSLSSRRK